MKHANNLASFPIFVVDKKAIFMDNLPIVNLQSVSHEGGSVLKVVFAANRKCKFAFVGPEGLTTNIQSATVFQVLGQTSAPTQNNTFGFTSFEFPFV